MNWDNSPQIPLTRSSVLRNAPEESGVYGLYSPGRWVYIGHSFDIRRTLLAYLSGQMPAVLQWQPKYFTYELMPYKLRMARKKELVAQWQPVCNRNSNAPRSEGAAPISRPCSAS